MDGSFVCTDERAETLAEHLEKVQWSARTLTEMPDQNQVGDTIATDDGPITAKELWAAIRKLKNGKAEVQVPAEYLKAAMEEVLGSFTDGDSEDDLSSSVQSEGMDDW